MAKRTLGTLWTRAFGRGLSALQRQAVRTGTQALKRALKAPAAKRVRKAVAKPKAIRPARKVVKPALRAKALKANGRSATPGVSSGDWLPGVAIGKAGTRRFHLYRPAGVLPGERLPLLVMLHGCGQSAEAFALSTRMNRLAASRRFLVLYPEQDRLANAQGCWNWFDTRSGRAWAEVDLILNAVDQVCQRHPVDSARVAVAGLSAGASMAALLATRHPGRFKAVVMHSGLPPGAAHSALSAIGAMRGRRRAAPAAVSAPLPVAAAATGLPWPPLLVIHGRLDTVVDVSNGEAAARLWAEAAGAHAKAPRKVQRGSRYPMDVTDYQRGGRTVARLVEVARLGHAWSGGAVSQAFSDGGGPDASALLWAFVARQFKC